MATLENIIELSQESNLYSNELFTNGSLSGSEAQTIIYTIYENKELYNK